MWPAGAQAPRLYGRGRTMDEWASRCWRSSSRWPVLVGASMGGYCAPPRRGSLGAARGARARRLAARRRTRRSGARSARRRSRSRARASRGHLALDAGALFLARCGSGSGRAGRRDRLDRTEDELVVGVEAIRDRPDSAAYRASAIVALRSSATATLSCRWKTRAASIRRRSCGRVRPPAEPAAARGLGRHVEQAVERWTTLDEVARRLGDDGFVVLDVRTPAEYRGEAVAPCDPRPGTDPRRQPRCRSCWRSSGRDRGPLGRARRRELRRRLHSARVRAGGSASRRAAGTAPGTTAAPGTSGRATSRCQQTG